MTKPAPASAVTHPVNPCPTPYAALNAVLAHFVEHVRQLLAANFVGAYLQGSFALGDFDDKSVVDFLIVVERDIADAEVPALNALHTAIHEFPEPWGHRLEGSYIPAAILRRRREGSSDVPGAPLPGLGDARARQVYPLLYLDHGAKTLVRSEHDNTQIVRWVTRESGIILTGPHPCDLIDEVSPNALRKETHETMHGRAAAWLADPAALDMHWAQAFAVGLYCRMLRTLSTGEVTSKKAAAAWACRTLDARWRPLISAGVQARPSVSLGPADPRAVAETRAFVAYALDFVERMPPELPTAS